MTPGVLCLISISLAKVFEGRGLDNCLATIEPLLSDSDNFKQRAGAELLAGVIRGKLILDFSLLNSRINRF